MDFNIYGSCTIHDFARLALFYGGLVYSKNLISVLIQCFAVACLMSIAWFIAGYSIAFTETGEYFGNLSKAFLNNVTPGVRVCRFTRNCFLYVSNDICYYNASANSRSFRRRAKFISVLLFSFIWLLIVYAPITHWIWEGLVS